MFRLNYLLRLTFIIIFLLLLASCAPNMNPTLYPNPSTASPTFAVLPTERIQSTSTPELPTSISPTPIQLPFNDKNIESKYCKPPTVYLPIPDTQGLSEDDITAKLMSLYLDYFNDPQAPDWCRIDGYRIDKVYYDEQVASVPHSPKGDFMRVVQFSIKLIQFPNYWMGYSGEIDQHNWFHISNVLAIFKFEADGVYTMKYSYP